MAKGVAQVNRSLSGRLALAAALLWGIAAAAPGSALATASAEAARGAVPDQALAAAATPVPELDPDEATQAARWILADRVSLYPFDMLEGMGFASVEEAREATVADPLPVSALDSEAVARGADTLAEALRSLDLVTFVVSGGGRPITQLTLKRDDAGYRFVELGGPGADLHEGLSLLPARSGARLVGYGPLDFLYLRHGETEYLVYLSWMEIPGIESGRLYTYEQVRADLQRFVARCRRNTRPDRTGFCPPDPEPVHPAALAVAAAGALGLAGACVHTFRRIARM